MDRELVVNAECIFLMAEDAQVHTATFNLESKLEELMQKEMPGVSLAFFSIENQE